MLRHLLVFALFLGGTVAITWPLTLHLPNSVPDLGDPLLNAWIIDWVCHALTHSPLSLFDAPIYHPATNILAFSEHMVGIALVVLPFHMAGLPAIAVYNIALLLGLAFSGYGAYVLARMITGHDVASVIGGAIYAFGSFKIGHVQHLQIAWSGWLPLLLAGLLLYWRRPTGRSAALLAAAFVMNGLTNIHWLLFGGFAMVSTIWFLQFAEPRRERAFWVRLGVALLVASLLLLPFLIPYQIVAELYGARRTSFEARLGSAMPMHWLVATARSVLYGRLFQTWRTGAERELFPGALAIALMVCAFLRSRPASRSSPVRAVTHHRAMDAAIALLVFVSIAVASAGRVRIGAISFAGADVPAMLATILLIVRLAPQLRSTLKASRFSTEELAAGLWIAIGFLGSLGWYFYLHPFLFRVVTPFRATRIPARWAVIAYVGIAVFAAIGAAEIAKRRKSWAAVLLVLVVADVAARVRWTEVPRLAPAYVWLASEKPAAVLEVPMIADHIPFLYLHAQTAHRVPLVNGTSGFETPAHEELRKLPYGEPFIAAAQRNGAEMLIVHDAALSDEQRLAIAPMLARLEPLRHFGSDMIFRIPRAPADTSIAPRESLPR